MVVGLGGDETPRVVGVLVEGGEVTPGEAAKVLLVVFFAAYLVDKRELLATGTRHIGRVRLPDPKHLGPLLLAWAFSILVMVREKDLGSSLLFFAVFAAMLYIATDRASYLFVALAMGELGPIGGRCFSHGHTASLALFRPKAPAPVA